MTDPQIKPDNVQAELVAKEFLDNFEMHGLSNRIKSECAKIQAESIARVESDPATQAARGTLIAMSLLYSDYATVVERSSNNCNLSEDGRVEQRRAAQEKLDVGLNELDKRFSELGVGLRVRFPPQAVAEPKDREEIERLSLTLAVLRGGSPQGVLTTLRDAIIRKNRPAIRYLLLEHGRQLERTSPHWRPYITAWRELVDLGNAVLEGTSKGQGSSGASDVLQVLESQYNHTRARAKRENGFDDTYWIGAPAFNRPEDYVGLEA